MEDYSIINHIIKTIKMSNDQKIIDNLTQIIVHILYCQNNILLCDVCKNEYYIIM